MEKMGGLKSVTVFTWIGNIGDKRVCAEGKVSKKWHLRGRGEGGVKIKYLIIYYVTTIGNEWPLIRFHIFKFLGTSQLISNCLWWCTILSKVSAQNSNSLIYQGLVYENRL